MPYKSKVLKVQSLFLYSVYRICEIRHEFLGETVFKQQSEFLFVSILFIRKMSGTAAEISSSRYEFSMNLEVNRRATFTGWPFDENCNCTAAKVCRTDLNL